MMNNILVNWFMKANDLLNEIDANCVRYVGNSDVYSRQSDIADCEITHASFMVSGVEYSARRSGGVFRKLPSGRLKICSGTCTCGTYEQIDISRIHVSLHRLLAVLFYPSRVQDLLHGGYVVNHMVIEPVPDYLRGASSRTRCVADYKYDADCIEIVTQSQNIQHGKFVARHNLYKEFIPCELVEKLMNSDYDFNTMMTSNSIGDYAGAMRVIYGVLDSFTRGREYAGMREKARLVAMKNLTERNVTVEDFVSVIWNLLD